MHLHEESSPEQESTPEELNQSFGQSPMNDHRFDFVIERFDRLNEIEQVLILSELEALHTTDATANAVEHAVDLYGTLSSDERTELFRKTLKDNPDCFNDTIESLIDQHTDYFPALIAVLNAVYDGHDIGLLTARGNRRGHTVLLDAIHDFVGHTIPRRNTYFVNDASRNARLPKENTAARKLQVLRDFLNGYYTDAEGNEKPMSKKYDEVIFYDDEMKNITIVADYARDNGLGTSMRAINAKEMCFEEQWEALAEKIKSGAQPDIGREPIIHFFDIDGTLVNIPARMYVVDTRSDEALITITQEEFAHNPSVDYWIEKARELDPSVPLDALEYDFKDFRDPERIEHMVRNGLLGNKMFVPEEKRTSEKHPEDEGDLS